MYVLEYLRNLLNQEIEFLKNGNGHLRLSAKKEDGEPPKLLFRME